MVGGGIVGMSVARALATGDRPLDVCVLEREDAVGRHQTYWNSGVIHAGVYYQPGSLKAQLCVEGARRLYEYCDDQGIPYQRCGKLIVAKDASEVPALDELERRANANGVPDLRRLTAEEIAEVEPHCVGVAALHSPHTGIVEFPAVAEAMAAEVRAAGGTVVTGAGVESTWTTADRVAVRHPGGQVRGRFAVFCAGLWSDRLAELAGADPEPRIVPFRGAYLRLAPAKADLIRGLIYPVPDPVLPFLGVHLTRHVGGQVSLGPTALLAPGRRAYRLGDVSARDVAGTLAWAGSWRMFRRWWRTGLKEMDHAVRQSRHALEASEYVPELQPSDFSPWFAGLRAQALGRDGALVDDFVIHETPRALHVRNAPSPAATSSLAIADMIAGRARDALGAV